MSTEKASPEVDPLSEDTDAALDQQIDELRGVLDKDAEGATGDDFGGDFGADFSGGGDTDADPLAAFGGDDEPGAAADFGGGDFGGTADFATDMGGTPDFGTDSAESMSPSDALEARTGPGNLDLIMDIPVDIEIILGKSRMQVSNLMNLAPGATIGLDRKIGEPVDIVVNGRVLGRGEITVLESDETKFGVKLIEVLGKTDK